MSYMQTGGTCHVLFAATTLHCLPGVHEHDMGSCSEVEGHPSCLQAHQEHPDIGVICELINHAIPVVHAHAALQPHTLHARLQQLQKSERMPSLRAVSHFDSALC